jgi:hypothetical protein
MGTAVALGYRLSDPARLGAVCEESWKARPIGVLPDAVAAPLARLEPYGMLILIGLLLVLPVVGAQLGIDLSIVSQVIASSTSAIIDAILRLTGNT